MRTNELRIGNWVSSELFGDYKIIGISNFSENNALFWKSYDYYPKACSIDSLKEIHLTEEWLVKLGFTKRSTSNDCNKWFKGENSVTHDWLFSLVWLVGHPTPFYQNGYHMIKYVHQLQNLYFALNGEELQL